MPKSTATASTGLGARRAPSGAEADGVGIVELTVSCKLQVSQAEFKGWVSYAVQKACELATSFGCLLSARAMQPRSLALGPKSQQPCHNLVRTES